MVLSLPTIRAMHALFEWEKWVDQSVNPSTGEAATKQKKAWNSLVVDQLRLSKPMPRDGARLWAND